MFGALCRSSARQYICHGLRAIFNIVHTQQQFERGHAIDIQRFTAVWDLSWCFYMVLLGRPSLTLLLTAFLLWSNPCYSATGYPNPFTPEQCGIARAHAEQVLRSNPNDERAGSTRAEALLCEGLQDDPGALDQAIDAFEQVLMDEPQNFFARLYLAEALRKRFFLSDDAAEAFTVARDALSQADVGAANAALDAYLARTLQELREQQLHFALVIHDLQAAVNAGAASAHQVGELLTLIAQTGRGAPTRALAMLDAYLGTHPNETLDTFYRAEILRGRLPRATLESLYRSAEINLCGDRRDTANDQACSLARGRLKRLEEGPKTPVLIETD